MRSVRDFDNIITRRMWLGIIAGPVLAAVLSILGSWWFFGRHASWSGEILTLIEQVSPYARDRDRVWQTFDNLGAELTTARTQTIEIRTTQSMLRNRLDIVEAKLDVERSLAQQHRRRVLAELRQISTRLRCP